MGSPLSVVAEGVRTIGKRVEQCRTNVEQMNPINSESKFRMAAGGGRITSVVCPEHAQDKCFRKGMREAPLE